MSKKRVFISFDFDNDKSLKDFLVGQAKNPNSPFEICDWSMKEAAKEARWQIEARKRIKNCDMVIVMVGKETFKAPGVLAEIKIAREEGIKVVQVIGTSNYTRVPDGGYLYTWSWDNLDDILNTNEAVKVSK